VHEYLINGVNEIGLRIGSSRLGWQLAPQKLRTDTAVGAKMRLLLPRVGQPCSELAARTVAELEWATESDTVYAVPFALARDVQIPIKFPRWRWLDAPVIEDVHAVKPIVLDFVQSIAMDLLRGDTESFLGASRLRLEELSVAYQQPLAEVANKLRARLHLLYATKALRMAIPSEDTMVLSPCAGGRLIECQGPQGEPLIKTTPSPDGDVSSWPLRIAVVNGRCHILR
jgi:hypothetical protein